MPCRDKRLPSTGKTFTCYISDARGSLFLHPTQPIVPAHGRSQPTHLTAKQIKVPVFGCGAAQIYYTVFDNFQPKRNKYFQQFGIFIITNNT